MSVKFQMDGDGLLYAGDISIFQAGQIIAFINNGEALVSSAILTTGSPVPLSAGQQPMTLREIIDQSSASGNPQRIVAAGYYSMLREQKETFSTAEVRSVFKRSGEPTPQNMTRDVKKAIRQGYIDQEAGARDSYYITDAGRRYLESGFPASGDGSPTKPKTTRTRTGTSSRDQINKELNEKLKAEDAGGKLQKHIAERQAAFDAKATNKAAIIAVWLLDNLSWDGVGSADLYTVYRFLGMPTGSTDSQLINAKVRDNYFGHSEKGKYILSKKGEDFGRYLSVDNGTDKPAE